MPVLCCVCTQAEVEGLHAALLQEKRAVVALRDELGLMATSRDTWRVSGQPDYVPDQSMSHVPLL